MIPEAELPREETSTVTWSLKPQASLRLRTTHLYVPFYLQTKKPVLTFKLRSSDFGNGVV